MTGGLADLGTQEVRVRTANGVTPSVKIYPGEARVIPLPAGDAISRLRVEEASTGTGRPLSLAEVAVPGVRVHRSLVLPRLPAAWGAPDSIVLRADRDARTGCARVDGVTCDVSRDATTRARSRGSCAGS